MKLFKDFDSSVLKELAPYLAATALATAALVLGVTALQSRIIGGGHITVAVFDVVKFANAQRALASKFLGKRDDPNEAGMLLLTLSKKTTATIEKIAGPGTLVLVKQGVVSGSQLDITDAVLTELGLPTDVPTADPMKYLQDIAPTTLMMPQRQSAPAPAPSGQADTNAKVLP